MITASTLDTGSGADHGRDRTSSTAPPNRADRSLVPDGGSNVKTILIVDDEAAIRETLEQILSYEGYSVRVAASGPKGLAEVERSEPDAMLLDIKMPDMDGLEVLQRLRASGATSACGPVEPQCQWW